MSRLDDRLTNELERAARPADPTGVFERIDGRRARRVSTRRIRMGALAVVVVLGCVGGFLALNEAFRTGGHAAGEPAQATIIFSSYPAPAVGQATSGSIFSLYAVAPDGSGLHRLSAEGDAVSAPSWSPDGSTIAYAPFSSGPDDPAWGIWLMDADGSNARQLIHTSGPVDAIDWSPDGSLLWFVMQQQPESGPVTMDLMSVEADGQGLRTLIDGRVVTGVSASPDGRSLALTVQANGIGSGVFVWSESSGFERVLPDRMLAYNPAWSPDGSKIAFLANAVEGDEPAQQPQQLFTINPDGSELHQVTQGIAQLSGPSWVPDSHRLIFGSVLARFDQFGLLKTPAECRLESINGDGSDRTTIFDGSDQRLCIAGTAWQPIGSGSATTPSPTPTGDAAVDLGLAFPVCDVRSIQADFDGDGTTDSASIATKMSDGGGCPAPGTATEVLVVDLNGDGKADAVGGPLACPSGCDPFATPDVDDDGLPEIAIVVDRPGDGTERIQLWDLTTPAGGSLAVIPFLDGNGDPATFTWGTIENWGGSGPEVFGVSCTSRTSPPLVTEWQAIPTGPDSWHISEHGYHVVSTELRSAFEDSYDVPGEETVFPDGGGDTMCGAPVTPSP